MKNSAHRPRKRFGQHFLADDAVIDAIIAAIAPRHEDRVVEIGPGLGALTHPLASRVDHLHVIEIDRDIVARMRIAFVTERVTIHEGDALQFDFSALGADLRIVGNLPYYISTPLLFHLVRFAAAIRDIHVMLQKEVIDRMVAAHSSSNYGRLSVMLQYRFQMEKLLEVPANAFQPSPKVKSALVRMIPYQSLPYRARDERVFGLVVAAAFAHRRKTLRNALKGTIAQRAFDELRLDAGARAQDLEVADFVRLADWAAKGIV